MYELRHQFIDFQTAILVLACMRVLCFLMAHWHRCHSLPSENQSESELHRKYRFNIIVRSAQKSNVCNFREYSILSPNYQIKI